MRSLNHTATAKHLGELVTPAKRKTGTTFTAYMTGVAAEQDTRPGTQFPVSYRRIRVARMTSKTLTNKYVDVHYDTRKGRFSACSIMNEDGGRASVSSKASEPYTAAAVAAVEAIAD